MACGRPLLGLVLVVGHAGGGSDFSLTDLPTRLGQLSDSMSSLPSVRVATIHCKSSKNINGCTLTEIHFWRRNICLQVAAAEAQVDAS